MHDPATAPETVVAAFEMDEILYELREHSAGPNIGRWDYIFVHQEIPREQGFLPRRPRAGHDARAFMRAYALLLVKTCHRRNAPAMQRHGGSDSDQARPRGERSRARKVRQDKLREVTDGCDGTWVAHPASCRSQCSTSTCRRRTSTRASART